MSLLGAEVGNKEKASFCQKVLEMVFPELEAELSLQWQEEPGVVAVKGEAHVKALS